MRFSVWISGIGDWPHELASQLYEHLGGIVYLRLELLDAALKGAVLTSKSREFVARVGRPRFTAAKPRPVSPIAAVGFGVIGLPNLSREMNFPARDGGDQVVNVASNEAVDTAVIAGGSQKNALDPPHGRNTLPESGCHLAPCQPTLIHDALKVARACLGNFHPYWGAIRL
ncbi:MAG: hypothetical protein WDO69_23500 [Pseudomonadota bacterium]